MIDIKKLDIKSGDCLLVSGNSWLSKAIKWFTKSEWSHAGIFLWLDNDLYVIEADRIAKNTVKAGVVSTLFTEYLESNKKLKIRRPQFIIAEERFTHICMQNIGRKRYDYFGTFLFQPLKQIFHKWFGKSTKNADNRFYCSEFVAYCYNMLYSICFKHWNYCTPEDLNTENVWLKDYVIIENDTITFL